ncbi:MAG TPA: hypothetical protein VGD89_02150 [Flavipsychrobacter sp.]
MGTIFSPVPVNTYYPIMCYYRIVFINNEIKSCKPTVQYPFIDEQDFYYQTNNGRIACGLLKADDAQQARALALQRLYQWQQGHAVKEKPGIFSRVLHQ